MAGDVCTRACGFCNVKSGRPAPLDPEEPANVANAVAEMGMGGALAYFDQLVQRASDAVPSGPGAAALRALLMSEGERLLPPRFRERAAPLAA